MAFDEFKRAVCETNCVYGVLLSGVIFVVAHVLIVDLEVLAAWIAREERLHVLQDLSVAGADHNPEFVAT